MKANLDVLDITEVKKKGEVNGKHVRVQEQKEKWGKLWKRSMWNIAENGRQLMREYQEYK